MTDSQPELIEVPDRELEGPLAPFPDGEIVDVLWSQGYRDIEIAERLTRQFATNDFGDIVRLWLRSLTLVFRIYEHLVNVPGSERAPLDQTARELRFRLLTLAVGSMKSGLDLALGGYYAQAWGQVRFMAECVIQMIHARVRPDSAKRWYESSNPLRPRQTEMSCGNAIDYIDKRQSALFDTTEEQMFWAEAKRLYILGHKGAHPSAEFLWQTEAEERSGFIIGPRYVSKASRGTLFWGVEAAFLLLAELARTEPIDDVAQIEMTGAVAEHTRLFNQYRAQAERDAAEIEQAVLELE